MWKKSRLIAGIVLAVNAVTNFIFFLAFVGKRRKKCQANTCLAVSIVSMIASAWMLWCEYNEGKKFCICDDYCADCQDGDCDDCCYDELFDEDEALTESEDVDCVINDSDATTDDSAIEF